MADYSGGFAPYRSELGSFLDVDGNPVWLEAEREDSPMNDTAQLDSATPDRDTIPDWVYDGAAVFPDSVKDPLPQQTRTRLPDAPTTDRGRPFSAETQITFSARFGSHTPSAASDGQSEYDEITPRNDPDSPYESEAEGPGAVRPVVKTTLRQRETARLVKSGVAKAADRKEIMDALRSINQKTTLDPKLKRRDAVLWKMGRGFSIHIEDSTNQTLRKLVRDASAYVEEHEDAISSGALTPHIFLMYPDPSHKVQKPRSKVKKMSRDAINTKTCGPLKDSDPTQKGRRKGGGRVLKPIDSLTREIKSLDGLWRFAPDSESLSSPWTSVLPGDLECPVPASYNDLFLLPSLRNHIGKVWYQRTVHIPRGWTDQRIFIRLDAATHEGVVYVGDTKVVTHVGGYTPFEADLTDHVKPGQAVRITVGVDNVLTNETVPPGEMVTNDLGQKEQKYFHDFFNYAGLARSVRLCCAPKNRVEDITVVTDVVSGAGVVNFKVELKGEGKVEVDLLDKEEKVVGSAKELEGVIEVSKPNLWQPGAAYLYSLRIRLVSGKDIIDEYILPVGIRSIRVSGKKFLINDKPFYFRGFGKHEDTPVKGKGHDDAWMVHDFELMRWVGANSFRTSHYPYAEDVMDYADKHGWVVIGETAAVGLNLGLMGGLTGQPKRTTFCPEFANDKAQAALKQGIDELIRRDKNHPSVVMWSITNEPDSGEKGSRPFFEPLVKHARELDPSRPLTYANVMFVKSDKDLIADLFDVIGLNRYYGWYVDTGNLEAAEKHLEAELRQWEEKFDKPLIIFEYGADTVSGLHSVHGQPWSEEYQAEYYEMYHRVFDRVDAVIGEQAWNFADFGTGVGIFRVDGNRKGVFSRDRRPKAAAFTFKKRWTGK